MNWIDEQNFGISHFGIHPDKLKYNNIGFDTFHMRYAITRKLIEYLEKLILN